MYVVVERGTEITEGGFQMKKKNCALWVVRTGRSHCRFGTGNDG